MLQRGRKKEFQTVRQRKRNARMLQRGGEKRIADRKAKEEKREDDARRQEERIADRNARQEKRKDSKRRMKEQIADTNVKKAQRSLRTWDDNLQQFITAKRDGPNWMCDTCGCLWFRRSVVHKQSTDKWVCRTCNEELKKGKVPKFALSRGLKFPEIPPQLRGLSVLEARFVALNLPFLQIRSLGGDRQCGIRGSAVHIPNELDSTVNVLPRTRDETRIIYVDLMRRMDHEKPYHSGRVRPAIVRQAAECLMSTPLYRSEGAVLSSTWDVEDAAGILEENQADEEETMLLNLEEFVLKIAPGQNKTPLALLGDPQAEAKAYPDKWCGQFLPNLEELKIGFAEFKKFQIRSADRRFTDPAILLHFYSLVLKFHIIKSQSTYGRKKKGRRMTAGDILDPAALNSLITHDFAFRIFKEVRTSPAYWEQKSKHILGMIRQLGIPNFFLTMSAAETYWPELIVILKKTVDNENINEEDVELMSMEQRSNLVRKDPVTCARYFENRFHAAFNLLIKPACGIFRPYRVIDFFYRTEFQHRGSPHIHMMLWIEGAPKFQLQAADSESDCLKFLDTILSCKCDEEGVIHQQHNHTRACRSKKKLDVCCRFNFPIPPMKETRIVQPIVSCPELRNRRRLKYKLLQDFLENTKKDLSMWSFENVLANFGWDYQQYLGILQAGIKRTTVFRRRRRPVDCFTNLYVPELARVWRSNMDLQMIFDPYGAAHYICSYITKSNAGISKLMKEISDQMRGESLTIKDKMRVIGQTFLNNVEISAQEAAYGLLGLPLTNASRDCQFIQTGKPEERIFLVKSEEELRNMCGDSTDIGVSGMLNHYVKRPDCIEDLCLADFVSWYTFSSKRRGLPESVTEECGQFSEAVDFTKCPFLPLKDGSGYVRRRMRQRIIRYRKYGEFEDPENFCRENLMLFIPWRDEKTELLDVDAAEAYNNARNEIILKRATYNALQKDLESVEPLEEVEDDDNNLDSEFACMDGQQGKINLLKEMLADTCQETVERIPVPHMIPFNEYEIMLGRLNSRQGQFLCHLMEKLVAEEVVPYFIYGGAGAGKSTLIDAIVQTVIRWVLMMPGIQVSTCKVLLMAPTGMVAFNIKGTTIHSALKLPLSQYQGELPPLTMGIRNTLACTLQDCKLVVIDEISMVSSTQLYLISRRLQQIFNSPEDFGGKQVVALGDLRQLSPVEAPSVFSPVNGMQNRLWESFRSFELTEVMRQRDDLKFAAALNNLAKGQMTDVEIEMFRDREVTRIGYPEGKCRRLYYQNAKVDTYNSRILGELTTTKMTFEAIDVIQGYGTDDAKRKLLDLVRGKPTKETSALPTTVTLVESAAYMLTRNLDTSDGLVNGAVGTLERISCGTDGSGQKIPTIAWMNYERLEVGQKRRKTLKRLSQREHICQPWTPIQIEKTPVRCWKSSNLSCIRGQFPLVPSEASTIHKSQGSTLDRILVNVEGLRRKALYVACSRARTIAGLYLEGEFKPPSCQVDDKTEMEMDAVKTREITLPIYQDPVQWIFDRIQHKDIPEAEPEEEEVATFEDLVPTGIILQRPIPLISTEGVYVFQHDILTLEPGEQLSDSVVDAFLKFLQRDPAVDSVGRMYAFTTPVVRVINELGGVVGDEDFEDQIGIQVIVFPLCQNHHWKVAVATRQDMKIRIYDSMDQIGKSSSDFLRTMVQLMNTLEQKYGGDPVWQVDFEKPRIPQQQDCNSCGVFVCYYAEMVTRGIKMAETIPEGYRNYIRQVLQSGAFNKVQ